MTTRSVLARAAFDRAQTLLDNARLLDAREQLQIAIDADPAFAYAHALLGALLPGPDGVVELDLADALATNLPESERLMIHLLRAEHDGDDARIGATLERLVIAVPHDWRVRTMIGFRELRLRHYDDAIASFHKALEISPDMAEVYAALAQANSRLRHWDEALHAARKRATLRPDEPSPQDMYGEVLLRANHFEQAEQAFRDALSIAPSFAIAWQGVGLARAYQSDLDGAHEAFVEGLKATREIDARLILYRDDAWISLADGKPAEALTSIAESEREAKAAKVVGYGAAPLTRGWLAYAQGEFAEARKQAQQAIARSGNGEYSSAARRHIRREATFVKLFAESRLGRVADAAKTLRAIKDDTRTDPDLVGVEGVLAHASGMLAWARNGSAAALEHLTACDVDDYWCAWHRMRAQEMVGDVDAARGTRLQMRSQSYRAGDFVYLRSTLPEGNNGDQHSR